MLDILPPHPELALFEAGASPPFLPVCDHYCGVEYRMRKSLALQAQWGPIFDVTLDNEDGAPVGAEIQHAQLIAQLLGGADNRWGRVGVRLLPPDHPQFEPVLKAVLQSSKPAAYLMLPKVQNFEQLQVAITTVDTHGGQSIPIHALIETHSALREVHLIAAHGRIQSLSFGLMDFVSAHRGAIPAHAMTVEGQFTHPLILRAKLEIAAACHAYGKIPSHCVVTEFKNTSALQQAAQHAAHTLGYTRMWSIHPDQIQPIVEAFTPGLEQVQESLAILKAAYAAHWAPIRYQDTLHDRASYRYYWHCLVRAQTLSSATNADYQYRLQEVLHNGQMPNDWLVFPFKPIQSQESPI